jgi:AraC-like DNA-binding protein
MARSFVLGGRNQGYSLDHFGRPHYIVIRFRSGGLSAFTRVPLSELVNLFADLDCIWDRRTVRELEDRLVNARNTTEQIAVLEKTLLKLLAPPAYFDELLYTADYLTTNRQPVTMLQLADSTNMSQKHFERLFSRHIGFRPNLFARITRFQKALYRGMHQTEPLSLSQLALRAGYYDQAHFGRDFKLFSGIAPGDFFSKAHDYVQSSTPLRVVDSVQDD